VLPQTARIFFYSFSVGGMSMKRVVSVASIVLCLLISAARAAESERAIGPAIRFPACSQSMIVGLKWQAVFVGVIPAPYSTGVNFSCPISIAANGSLTPGNCTISNALVGLTVTQPPSGVLTIDRACHVIGSITYVTTYGGNTASYQMLVSLSRSIDGSRLSGFSQTCASGICNAGEYFVFPFEMIAGQW
jgi:hypothetical protein